ncbi:MAG: hypothetical protein KGK08_04770 [Acidobacteriota bacterium]|nr:hypothetical protein [Acidobacteriota bacterium]
MQLRTRGTRALLAGIALAAASALQAQSPALNPATMTRLGSVDERFASYNIEMVEVTGGRFWAPYKTASATPDQAASSVPVGMDPSLYRYRAPIDLSNPRLRKLAAALGPAYVRVSGTWANRTYFQDNDAPAMTTPPEGFGGVLTRAEWKGVVDFSKAVDARIVTSFAVSTGVRDANQVWTPVEAAKVLAYTHSIGGSIAAAEMFNEPTMATIGGAPKGYDGEAYGRDFKVFAAYMRKAAPGMTILGPGSVGEGGLVTSMKFIPSEDMLKASGPGVDAFSYHFYGGVSLRCRGGLKPEGALDASWLDRTVKEEAFYAALRDKFEPGKPMWLTETGEAACGGDPWASTFLDTFRYLNQLGVLARLNVQTVMHNTLAASDYGLIDQATLEPRPNYWATLLWRKLMGTTVLDAGTSNGGLRVYAQCLRGAPGGVAMLVLNTSTTDARTLQLPLASERYTLTAPELQSTHVLLNGHELTVGADNALPALPGLRTASGSVPFAPASITFLAVRGAHNSACQR